MKAILQKILHHKEPSWFWKVTIEAIIWTLATTVTALILKFVGGI